MTNLDKINAKVQAVNLANKTANQLHATLVQILTPFIGQQIIKADGKLRANITKLLPKFPNDTKILVYQGNSEYNLYWIAKACQGIGDTSGNHTCLYHETSVYVANITTGVLVSLHDAPNFREDYTVDEVIAAKLNVDEAQRSLDKAKAVLNQFTNF